jgi:hypothetical protein
MSAHGEAVLQMAALTPFMAARLSGPYLRMKRQVKNARRTFYHELVAAGMSPRDAGRLADEYASAASLRTVLRTLTRWTG